MRGAPGSIISLFGYSHGTLRFFWREISAGVVRSLLVSSYFEDIIFGW
jgi:hypothetical protein